MDHDAPLELAGAMLPGRLFLAPVAGYSDAAYRSVCADHGCDLAFTEMVSSEALTRGSEKTKPLLARAENEKAYAIQIFGSSPTVMARAASMLEGYAPLLVDINCGCPVPKIVKTGAGSALMKEPARIAAIVRAVRDSQGAPVTVKIRLGWDASSINYLDAAEAAVGAGAAAVTLHARTREQGYSGKADWTALKALVEASPVPVFGSGDVFSADDVARMFAETGVGGVMVARGAIGNPFIFAEAKSLLRSGRSLEVGWAERVAAARRHYELSVRFLGERVAGAEFRKAFCAYTKGATWGAALRAEAVKASTRAEWDAVFGAWEARAL